MSGRIRTLKPEILDDERTAHLTHEAWRVFVSLILLADDYGNFRAHPSQLDGAIFWSAPSESGVENLLVELADTDLVTVYEVRGQRYGHLNGWAKNQRVDKPGAPRVPNQKEGTIVDITELSRTPPGSVRESFAPDLRSPIPITDPDHRSNTSAPRVSPAEEVFEHYVSGWKAATDGTRKPVLTDKRKKLVAARLKEGHSVDALKRACDGLWLTPWNMGENPGSKKYIDFELVMRDAAHVERFAQTADEHAPPAEAVAHVPEHAPIVTDPAELARIREEALAGVDAALKKRTPFLFDEETAELAP